jgi:hypothetical protein
VGALGVIVRAAAACEISIQQHVGGGRHLLIFRVLLHLQEGFDVFAAVMLGEVHNLVD